MMPDVVPPAVIIYVLLKGKDISALNPFSPDEMISI
jgi:hypothetical protein